MSLGLNFMSLMSLGVVVLVFGTGALGDEFWGWFLVCLLTSGVHLMRLGVLLMSLGVRLQRELGDEFGVEFAEFDDFGG